MAGIENDAPRGGRTPVVRDEKEAEIIRRTNQETLDNATHWSLRSMAEAVGVSYSTVRCVWRDNGLKPHLIKTFKVSNDPHFAEKLVDVVGLYLKPSEHALVLSVDEKSQILALDRTQKSLPMFPGRLGTLTQDYNHNGTTTLFGRRKTCSVSKSGLCPMLTDEINRPRCENSTCRKPGVSGETDFGRVF